MLNKSVTKKHKLEKQLGWLATGAGLFLATRAIYDEINKYNLAGRVVLITGSSRGLGLVLARQLAAMGARLAICARSSTQLSNAKIELERSGAKVLALQADLTKQDEVNVLIRDVVNHYGRLDVLINNAGIVQVGPQETMTVEDYQAAMDTNFWAALYTMHAALPHFNNQGEGRIVNITSIGGKIAVPHLLPYTVSKFALVGLSEGMHAELKKENIHVTTVVPNLMRTGSPRNITVKGDHESEYAWFKYSDSLPLTSQAAENAAQQVIKALIYGRSEVTLTYSAKLATLVKALAPGWVSALLSLTNRFLPANVPGGYRSKKGYESESSRSKGKIPALTDRAAIRNNEM